jgi:hypothetical protein
MHSRRLLSTNRCSEPAKRLCFRTPPQQAASGAATLSDRLADFGADTLAQTIQQQLQNLGGIAGLGLGATNSTANFGQQTANNVSNSLTQQGQARASGSLAIGGINNQMWNNAGSFLDQAVSAALGAGAGPGGAPFSLGKFVGGF